MSKLIYATNNAYDTILTCDSSGAIIGRATVTPDLFREFYQAGGTDAADESGLTILDDKIFARRRAFFAR